MKKLLWIISVLTFITIVGVFVWWHTNVFISIDQPSPEYIANTSDTEETNRKTPPPATSPQNISLEEKIGQLFIIGHWTGNPVASTTNLISKHHLGGVIIMGNPDKASNTKEWTKFWQDASETPLFISVDQEGGAVTRYKEEGFIQTGQREITDTQTAYEVGYTRGKELANLGINMNFAPVLDSAHNPDSFMYERVFADRSNSATLAASMIDGMKVAGVIGVVKHFPGHDDTSDDSHHTLPVVNIESTELDDFVSPFTEIIKNNPPNVIMPAHVLFPKIDPLPATLSKFFLTDYLRNELGFSGIIITDDMSMDAIDTNWSSAAATVLTIEAGADIVLFAAEPKLVSDAIRAVMEAVKTNTLSEERINESYNRIMSLKKIY